MNARMAKAVGYMKPDIDPNTRLYVPFNEGVGSVAKDYSQYGNHVTLTDVEWSPDGFNGAGKFDDFSSHGDCGSDISLSMYSFTKISESPDINVHQGVTTDGTYFYLFHTTHIKKTDQNWNQVAINTNVNTECGNSHIGDGCYYDGKLYVATDNWTSCSSYLPSKISIWDASDLSFIETHDISAQGHENASLVVDGGNNIIYIVSYCDETKIWKYNLANFSYIGYITLSKTLSNMQGIAKKGNYFYIASMSIIYKVALNGTVEDTVYCGINEGIDYTQNILYGLNDPGEIQIIYGLTLSNANAKDMTIEIGLNTSYLPSELPSQYMRIVWTGDDANVLYYDREGAKAIWKITTSEGNTPRPEIIEGDLFKNQLMRFSYSYDHDKARLYLNGVLKSTKNRDNTNLIYWRHWYIGCTGPHTVNGAIAFILIYALIKSTAQIAADCYEVVCAK